MGKKRNVISTILSIIGGLTVIVVLWSCLINHFFPMVIIEEASRITSPDGKVDVVVMNRHAGATTSLTEQVYVVPSGRTITKMDRVLDRCVPVFVADSIEGKNIHWIRDRVLEIQYDTARIYNFRNYVRPLSQNVNYIVEIRQTPLKESSLPSY